MRIVILFLSLVLFTGCLKTRAQLREEGDTYESQPTHSSAPAASNSNTAPMGSNYAIDEMKSELMRMNGRMDDLERAQKQGPGPDAVTKADLKKFEDRIAELENNQAQLIQKFNQAAAQANAEAAVASNPESLYESAQSDLESGEYAKAIDKLGQYLKISNAKHIQEATFLKAEAHYRIKEYKKAIVEYSKFPEKYKKSKHMPASLFKIGLCFEALGMKEDAKPFYQELIEKFPKAPEAKSARAKLK